MGERLHGTERPGVAHRDAPDAEPKPEEWPEGLHSAVCPRCNLSFTCTDAPKPEQGEEVVLAVVPVHLTQHSIGPRWHQCVRGAACTESEHAVATIRKRT